MDRIPSKLAGLLLVAVMLACTGAVKLPDQPDLKNLSKPLAGQISDAHEKALQNPSADNLGNLGMVYHSGAFYDKAAVCYKLAINKKKSAWKWHYYLGYIYLEMGESAKAITCFTRVLRYNPEANHAWYYIGEEHHNLGSIEQAIDAFSRVDDLTAPVEKGKHRTDFFPLGVYADFQLARVYMESKQYDMSRSLLQEIVRLYPSFGPAYRLLGNIYNVENNPAQSKRYTNRANDLAVFTPPVDSLIDRLSLMSRSELYLLKKIDEAQNGAYAEWAMQLMINGYKYLPENKHLISKFIKLYLMMDFGRQSSPLLAQHRNLFSDDYNEIGNVAMLLYEKGLYDQALEHYRVARKIKPEAAHTQKDIILCLWQTERKKTALDSTLKWLIENQRNVSVLSEGVGLLVSLREVDRARFYFAKLKSLSPNTDGVFKLSAKLAQLEGNNTGAVKWCEEAYSSNPSDFENVKMLINLLVQQEQWQKGIKFMSEAMEHHPGEPFLLEQLATLLITCPDKSLRDIPAGIEYAERAFYHISSKSYTLTSAGRSLAMAHLMQGNKEEAMRTLQLTIKMAKNERLPASYIAELEKVLTAMKQ